MTSSGLVRAGQFNQAVRQGAYIIIALALPRLGIPTEQIGEWESLLFLGFVLGFGWTTGLLQGFLIKMGKFAGLQAEGFARAAVITTGLFSAGILAIAALFHAQLFVVLQLDDAPVGWYFFFVLLLSRWPSYCFEQALLLTGRAGLLTLYAVFNALGLVLSLLLPLYLGYDLLSAMKVLAGFAGAKAFGLVLWSLVGSRKNPVLTDTDSRAEMSNWLRISRPLMAYATVGALVSAVDPWIVNYWSGGDEEIFAIFRYGVRELPFLAALINGMTVVAIPVIARDKEGGLKILRDQSRKLFHYIFALTFLMMLTAEWWWTRVFTEAFADSLPVFYTYLLVVGCRLVFAMTVLTALNETRKLYLWGLLELAVNVVLSLALAPRYGLLGIIWATVIASYFHEVCLVLYLRYCTGTDWHNYADLRWYGTYLLGLFLAYWWVT
ncbi:O-antigen/teichoic acid export membrane protein [Lewinella aquimaris]|uniref:O-antigen/teichoic acid export membrane protein n=1 Tax=Neolewinella aquimaris TaxID=1835722 RepID=A0A840ECF5_9BACT|nr:polysaccharide biosynthesis C-terminal domain-containing protein [Neolewinella aquimaris]MBB4079668.1 O-antigen/teichoic acid export membrane protein [Neolewinella aquimaris]